MHTYCTYITHILYRTYIHTYLFLVSVCLVELHDELVLLHNGVGDVAQLPAEGGHGFLVTHDLDIASFQLLASGELSIYLCMYV